MFCLSPKKKIQTFNHFGLTDDCGGAGAGAGAADCDGAGVFSSPDVDFPFKALRPPKNLPFCFGSTMPAPTGFEEFSSKVSDPA